MEQLVLIAKSDLVTLKTLVDKIGIDKFITVPAASSKLSNVVDSDVADMPTFPKPKEGDFQD